MRACDFGTPSWAWEVQVRPHTLVRYVRCGMLSGKNLRCRAKHSFFRWLKTVVGCPESPAGSRPERPKEDYGSEFGRSAESHECLCGRPTGTTLLGRKQPTCYAHKVHEKPPERPQGRNTRNPAEKRRHWGRWRERNLNAPAVNGPARFEKHGCG